MQRGTAVRGRKGTRTCGNEKKKREIKRGGGRMSHKNTKKLGRCAFSRGRKRVLFSCVGMTPFKEG